MLVHRRDLPGFDGMPMERTDMSKKRMQDGDSHPDGELAGTIAEFTPAVAITGLISRGKYLVHLNARVVKLSNILFVALCDLVLARIKTSEGRTGLPSLDGDRNRSQVTIHRLRRAIDAEIGAGAGEAIIVPVGRGEYQLNVTREAILVHERIAELAPCHLSEKIVKDLLVAAADRGLLCKQVVSAM
jgi:hypothetical protein